MSQVDSRPDRMPRHIAIIMDGNGRWAQLRGLERNEGHRAGLESVRDTVRAAGELGIDCLTLYAFSSENWNRPKEEVGELMRLLEYYLDEELEEAMEKGVRVRAIGRLDRLPPSTRAAVQKAVEATKHNGELDLIFALSYGGRTEITDAARRLIRDAELGHIDPDQLDEKTFSSYLYAPDVPDPDLLIRTGNEYRVSNFLLWQIAYTEIHTTAVMWPDFRREHLERAIADYQARERRFGRTPGQVAADGGEEPSG
ncbi:MAG: isoprenyl transferase [Deltaproteobacteria bacterium]|jgi:undecaprenyl diphosphate synthase|nr:isoprenyl transferase [Deltaproteobacteria bacterium]MBW2385023.1 isoprenyl transferase [Deltaproteobacteria bacterium]